MSSRLVLPLTLALSFLVSACPQDIGTPNSGTDSGSNTTRDATSNDPDAGSNDDDTGTPPGEDTGVHGDLDATTPPPDTGVTPDAGGGPLAPLTWGEMTIPPNTNAIMAIWGRSIDEMYAGTFNGNVLQFDSTNGWRVVWHEPSNFGIHHIGGTPAKIFVASESSLHVHTGGIQQNPQSLGVGRSIHDMYVVSDTEVYLVSDQQNGRGLYKYDGNQIVTLNEPTTVATLGSVYKPSGGPVFVGGNGAMFRYELATLTPETVEWPAGLVGTEYLYTFTTIRPIGSTIFAGSDRQLIFERGADRVWRAVFTPFTTDGDLFAIAGFQRGPDLEAYLVGDSGSQGPMVRYLNGTFETDQFPDTHDLNALWASDADNYFAGGNLDNTFTGVIFHGGR